MHDFRQSPNKEKSIIDETLISYTRTQPRISEEKLFIDSIHLRIITKKIHYLNLEIRWV